MEDPTDLFARRLALLDRLIEGGAELAELARQDAVAAPTPETREAPSRRFHRLTQGVGRLIALEARLAGEAEAALKAFRKRATAQRRAEAEAALQPRICASPRQHQLHQELWRLLSLEEIRDSFLDEPAEALVTRLAQTLDLPGPASAETSGAEQPAPPPAHPREGGDPPSARPREGGDPCAPSTPASAWVHACAGTSGEESLNPSAHPREGGDPSGPSTPSLAWVPACAGTSGEEGAHPPTGGGQPPIPKWLADAYEIDRSGGPSELVRIFNSG